MTTISTVTSSWQCGSPSRTGRCRASWTWSRCNCWATTWGSSSARTSTYPGTSPGPRREGSNWESYAGTGIWRVDIDLAVPPILYKVDSARCVYCCQNKSQHNPAIRADAPPLYTIWKMWMFRVFYYPRLEYKWNIFYFFEFGCVLFNHIFSSP